MCVGKNMIYGLLYIKSMLNEKMKTISLCNAFRRLKRRHQTKVILLSMELYIERGNISENVGA